MLEQLVEQLQQAKEHLEEAVEGAKVSVNASYKLLREAKAPDDSIRELMKLSSIARTTAGEIASAQTVVRGAEKAVRNAEEAAEEIAVE